MTYDIQVRDMDSLPMAAARGRANAENVADQIPALLSKVWEFIRATGVQHSGTNAVLYHINESNKELFRTDVGIPIEAGVLVTGEFTPQEAIVRAALPAGRVATTIHMGPYELLPATHAAIRQWCAANGHALAGPSWEIYGHWSDDPAELRTDVFYLLRN